MKLVALVDGRQEKLPDYRKGKKAIKCDITSFVLMFAVTKQKAGQFIAFSKAEGNFARERKAKDTTLDLLKPFAEGIEERDASSSTPTAGGDFTHEVVEEQSLDEKLPSFATDAGGYILAEDTKSKEGTIRSPPRGKPQSVHSFSERPQL